ncbi:unnamed protein product [Mytilus edulis]|uniref:Uncharacterized protein n=1 Tax=Mytilus edulis TaxID=6550 RepID=A0A8S3S7R5_MYTED|nr:unnamed protein product [Mytilus edulis]
MVLSQENSRTEAGIYNKGQTKQKTDTLHHISQQISSASHSDTNSNENDSEQLHDATDDSDEKGVAKFCQMYDCDNHNGGVDLEEFNINSFNSQLLKNQKMIDRFNEMVADIQMQHNLQNPRKTNKKTKQIKNGCRFCQSAKEQIILLANHMQTDDLDFVIVDINESSLPDYLQVPFTPYIRYKYHALSKWIDYSGEEFDFEHILSFLHTAAQ